MMKQIPIKNSNQSAMYVGGFCIAPGETRLLPKNMVPPDLRPEPIEPAPDQPAADPEVADLVGDSVKAILPHFPRLESAQLAELAELEQSAEKPRSTLLSAIAEETLRRADANAVSGDESTPEDKRRQCRSRH